MARALPTSIRLDPDIKAALEKAATADGRSVSNLMDRILREWLVKKKHLAPPEPGYDSSMSWVL